MRHKIILCNLFYLTGAGSLSRSSLHQTSLELGRDVGGVEGGVVEAEVGGGLPGGAVRLLRRVLRGLPPLVHLAGHGHEPVEAHVDLLHVPLAVIRGGAVT